MTCRFGLRFRLNAVIVPLFVATLTLFAWMDYQHEVQAFTAIQQAARSVTPGDELKMAGPAEDPTAIARRSLAIHSLHGALTIVLLITATNAALTTFVLNPVERIRSGMARMERGHWRAQVAHEGNDEMAQLHTDFQRLGLTLDAVVTQALSAERRGSLALVSKTTTRLIEPEVQQIAAGAAALQRTDSEPTRRAALAIAVAAARITAAIHSLDRLFESSSPPMLSRPRGRGDRGETR